MLLVVRGRPRGHVMSAQSDDYVSGARETLLWLRAVIDNQVEARTPKPARIEEPGQWGVVEAGLATYLPESGITYDFVKHDRSYWISKSFPQLAVPWDNLIDPVLIREGLS